MAQIRVAQIKLGEIAVEVVLKDIKHLHLSVHPPTGRVSIAAPARMNLDTIRVFAISKLPWIREQQSKLREQERETPREYLNRESHYLWGKRYLLEVIERLQPPAVYLKHRRMTLVVPPGTEETGKGAVLAAWYRDQIRSRAPALIGKWEPLLGVRVRQFFIQQMKTRWGSCNPGARTIRLNTELAKKPIECLDYIVLHEMAHLVEPAHGERFVSLMDRFMPKWQFVRQKLNRLPVRHVEWDY